MTAIRLIANGIDITDRSAGISFGSSNDTISSDLTFESVEDLSNGTLVSLYLDGKAVLIGIITDLTPSNIATSYTVRDFGYYLDCEVKKQFNSMSADKAIASLLSEYGIKLQTVPIPTLITKIYVDTTIAGIIDDILQMSSAEQGKEYRAELQGDKINIYISGITVIDPLIEVEKGYSHSVSIADMINRVLIVSGEDANAKALVIAENQAMIKKYGLRQAIEKIEADDIAKAQQMANNILKANCREKHTASVNALVYSGGGSLRAGRLINLSLKDIRGKKLIKSVNHSIDNGIHKATIEMEW